MSMLRSRASRRDGEVGLSLVSLLLVVLLLGVLVAMALALRGSDEPAGRRRPRTVNGGAPGSETDAAFADRVACEASARAIETAAQAYYVGHDQTWPPDIAALTDPAAPYLRSPPDPGFGLVYDPATGTVDATACRRR